MNVGDKTLEQRLAEFILALGIDIKHLKTNDTAIETKIGSLANLNTTQKGSIIGAINEVLALADLGANVIDNTPGIKADKTYSQVVINELLNQLKQQLLGGIPAQAFDTIKEIADWIENDETAMAGFISSIAKRVAVDSAQTFTDAERLQGRANIGAQEAAAIGDTNTDLVALYVAAKA